MTADPIPIPKLVSRAMDESTKPRSRPDGNTTTRRMVRAVARVPTSVWIQVRQRVIAGLILAIPILVTFALLYFLFKFLRENVFNLTMLAIVNAFDRVFGEGEFQALPWWWQYVIAPALALVLVVLLLYVLGMFFSTRLHRALDWMLLRLPIVTPIYQAAQSVVNTLADQAAAQQKFKRVVLIGFPHPGTKVPAFVMKSIRDAETGRTILCVYVPTTPFPTSGYMLLVPEDDVTELDWSINQAMQAVVSGGITAPEEVRFHRADELDAWHPGSPQSTPIHPTTATARPPASAPGTEINHRAPGHAEADPGRINGSD